MVSFLNPIAIFSFFSSSTSQAKQFQNVGCDNISVKFYSHENIHGQVLHGSRGVLLDQKFKNQTSSFGFPRGLPI